MLGVDEHLLRGDDESEVVQEEELEFKLVEFWKRESTYLRNE